LKYTPANLQPTSFCASTFLPPYRKFSESLFLGRRQVSVFSSPILVAFGSPRLRRRLLQSLGRTAPSLDFPAIVPARRLHRVDIRGLHANVIGKPNQPPRTRLRAIAESSPWRRTVTKVILHLDLIWTTPTSRRRCTRHRLPRISLLWGNNNNSAPRAITSVTSVLHRPRDNELPLHPKLQSKYQRTLHRCRRQRVQLMLRMQQQLRQANQNVSGLVV
jgi:hypothetical protein